MDSLQEIVTWLRLFMEPGQVTELRALDVSERGRWEHTEAGYFNDMDAMAREALRLTDCCKGVYFIPNPVHADCLSRCCNKVKTAKRDESTSDSLILRRRWLLVDADPVRIEGVSATDAEKSAAFETIMNVKEWFCSTGLEHYILADSGNGYHFLKPIDLPTDDGEFVKRILNNLGDKFDTEAVKIDRKVFNPARIVKLYGTMARKGDHTPERPHRWTKVLEHT